MGLFSNNKKLCPICGSPTPRFLATKFENEAICKDCDNKIDLPDGVQGKMTLADFRQYIARYDENAALRSSFSKTFQISYGFLSGSLQVDEAHGLFRLKDNDRSWAFPAAALKGFRILEDTSPIYESGAGVLRCHESIVPARMNEIAPLIAQFQLQRQEYEHIQTLERMRHLNDDEDARREWERESERNRPEFEMDPPIKNFHVELTLEHPYWHSFHEKLDAPEFDRENPSAERYMKDYQEKAEQLHALALKLMRFIDPAAREEYPGAKAAPAQQVAQPAAPANAIEEIQKYKALMDAGILTEEEFTAKKRQLLGI